MRHTRRDKNVREYFMVKIIRRVNIFEKDEENDFGKITINLLGIVSCDSNFFGSENEDVE